MIDNCSMISTFPELVMGIFQHKLIFEPTKIIVQTDIFLKIVSLVNLQLVISTKTQSVTKKS